MLVVVATVVTSFLLAQHGYATSIAWLPGPKDFTLIELLAYQFMSIFIMMNLWPVVTCIIADIFRVKPYVVRNLFSLVVAVLVQVAGGIVWLLVFATQPRVH